MTSTFSFTTPDCEYIHKISPSVVLHLYRTNHAVAILYFTDEMNNRINIPRGLVISSKDFQTNKQTIQKPMEDIYALCWTDDYVVEFNDKLVLDIKNKRVWDITLS